MAMGRTARCPPSSLMVMAGWKVPSGGHGAMRVDEVTESSTSGGPRIPFGLVRVVGVTLLAGAAVLAVVAVYFLATTCWDYLDYSWQEREQFGCRTEGALEAFYPLVIAQFLGALGFVVLRRASRRRQGSGVAPTDTGSEPGPPATSSFRFWSTVALSVLLLGVSLASLLYGLIIVAFACWEWQGPATGCALRVAKFGLGFAVLGGVLGIGAFLIAGWAIRRRPWRRDAQEEHPET